MPMDLLRFSTAGSVDDGKSTLIGRLLYDSKAVLEDQYEAIKRVSEQRGENYVNLALLTDGLRAEREQGITIDVAYRYFSTPLRKFIIADTPGHIQYTRNMVTGASTVNLALVLIDARHGMVEQSKRHLFLASLLGIPHVVICVNKMDLVNYDRLVFERIYAEVRDFMTKMQTIDVRFVPISALNGDNIVHRSEQMAWYEGPTLLYLLETVHIAGDHNHIDCRFPVQSVIRPHSDEYHDYRGYTGRVAGGIFKPGDEIVALPSGFGATITAIETADGAVSEAYAPMSVTIRIDNDLDISRGDMLVRPNNMPHIGQDLELMICWLGKQKMVLRGKYVLKHTHRDARCMITNIKYKLNINTLHRMEGINEIGMNDIARISIRSTQPLFYDSYRRNRVTGSLILIDESTNETVAAGMIV
jgi:sulfate adenylyltransferase subunit 1